LNAELKLFPNLKTIVVLGEDAYRQFQEFVLGRTPAAIRPLGDLLKEQGWAREDVSIPALGERRIQAFYCFHPTFVYTRSPSIAAMLA
jgi:hypothetical protein